VEKTANLWKGAGGAFSPPPPTPCSTTASSYSSGLGSNGGKTAEPWKTLPNIPDFRGISEDENRTRKRQFHSGSGSVLGFFSLDVSRGTISILGQVPQLFPVLFHVEQGRNSEDVYRHESLRI
jgi:hypothetical protein